MQVWIVLIESFIFNLFSDICYGTCFICDFEEISIKQAITTPEVGLRAPMAQL